MGGAFDAEDRVVSICRRILAVAEENSIKPDDLKVLKWIATRSSDLEQVYSIYSSTVKEKARAVLDNVKEANSFNEYIQKTNYPSDLLVTLARREYATMLEKQLELNSDKLPTVAESEDLAQKAGALQLEMLDVQVVHEAQFAPAYGEACKKAVSAETDELLSELDAMRVRLVFSEDKAKKLMQDAIAEQLKPAVEQILDGYRTASGEKLDDDKKPIGFQGGVDGAIDQILDLSKKSFIDFTLVTMGLVNFSASQPLYKYVERGHESSSRFR